MRGALLHLHKTLLARERAAYERVHGRVTAGELLQLIIQHEHFACLHAVSEAVVRIDVLLDVDLLPEEPDALLLLTGLRSLLVPSENGCAFASRYHHALQQDPAAVLAHWLVLVLLLFVVGFFVVCLWCGCVFNHARRQRIKYKAARGLT